MKVLIFGGTTEGRTLCMALSNAGIDVTLSVATEFGMNLVKTDLPRLDGNLTVLSERLGTDSMICLVQQAQFDYVIDATHPYATEVTGNICSACKTSNIKYYRLKRPEIAEVASAEYVPNADAAAEILSAGKEKAFLSVGSKELERFALLDNYAERFYIRILPMLSSLQKALDLGFRGPNIICMQGPFDVEMNTATLKMTGAKYMVTKDSGDAGGFKSKITAAQNLGCKIIVIKRPVKEDGYTYGQIVTFVTGIRHD
jgi:precorrin-6x reductase